MRNWKGVAGAVVVALGAGLLFSALVVLVGWRCFRHHPSFNHEQMNTLDRLRTIEEAIAKYQGPRGQLPASLAELGSPDLLRRCVGRDGQLVDGWGHPFRYSVIGGRYSVLAYGRDGKPGGTGLDLDLSYSQRLPEEAVPTLHQFLFDRPTGGLVLFGSFAGLLTFIWVLWQAVLACPRR